MVGLQGDQRRKLLSLQKGKKIFKIKNSLTKTEMEIPVAVIIVEVELAKPGRHLR